MSDTKKLVIINSRGLDDERSSVAFSIANTASASNMDVTMFLVSAGADWARKGAAEFAHLNPLDPTIGDMMKSFMDNGGRILVCPPCAGVRGYEQDDLMDGVTLAGSVAMLDVVQQGAEAITF